MEKILIWCRLLHVNNQYNIFMFAFANKLRTFFKQYVLLNERS